MTTWRLLLDADRSAPRQARRAVRGWIQTIPCDEDTKDDVLLVVNELVASAAVAGSSQILLVATFSPGWLRVETFDDQHRPPGGTGVEDELSRTIVTAATDGWGWSNIGTGTHMWSEKLW